MNRLLTLITIIIATVLFQEENDNSIPLLALAQQQQQPQLLRRPIQPRIVNGETVIDPTLEYSYFASMANYGSHKCGGVLIASDIVLTSAHCAGRFNEVALGKKSYADYRDINYESYVIADVATHPRYYENADPNNPSFIDNDPYDIAMIKIHGRTTSLSPIQVNSNSSIPSKAGTDLRIMGFGVTSPDNLSTTSSSFNRGIVQYIPNEECKAIEGTFNDNPVSFKSFIIDVSLCAADFAEPRQDICSGDSGGPIVLEDKENEGRDPLLIGLVLSSIECASPNFPAIYIRTSETIVWMTEQICLLSNDPPSYFNCPSKEENKEEKDEDEVGMISATLEIQFINETNPFFFDDGPKPQEVGWVIESTTSNTKYYEYRNIFTYSKEDLIYPEGEPIIREESIMIPNDASYKFVLLTRESELIQKVILLSVDQGEEIIYFEEELGFPQYYTGTTVSTFDVGTVPSMIPTTTTRPTMTPTTLQELNKPYFSIDITFDKFSVETGWSMEAITFVTTTNDGDDDDENDSKEKKEVLLDVRYPGNYKEYQNGDTITEIIPLLVSDNDDDNSAVVVESYKFTMTDNEGDGICCNYGDGSVSVYYNSLDGEKSLLFEITNFVLEDTHIIPATRNGIIITTDTPVVTTTTTPTDSPIIATTNIPVVVVENSSVEPTTSSNFNQVPVVVVVEPQPAPTKAPVLQPLPSLSPVVIVSPTEAPAITELTPILAPVAVVKEKPTDTPIATIIDDPITKTTDTPTRGVIVVTPTNAPIVLPTDVPIVPPTIAPFVPPTTEAPVEAPTTDAPVVINPPTNAPVVVQVDTDRTPSLKKSKKKSSVKKEKKSKKRRSSKKKKSSSKKKSKKSSKI